MHHSRLRGQRLEVGEELDLEGSCTLITQAIYDRYKDTEMKIAEDDEEKKIKLKIMKYYKYMLHQRDDSPLYMFQSGFNELEGTEHIIKNYKVPVYFQEDYFNYVKGSNQDERGKAASLQVVFDRPQAVGDHSPYGSHDDFCLEHLTEWP